MTKFNLNILVVFTLVAFVNANSVRAQETRPRIIVTTDGEADDRASMVRFLLHSNDFDIEAIVNSSSQFHWKGGDGWNAFHPVHWIKEYIELYRKVYPNLILHDSNFPSPDVLLDKWSVGNIEGIGEDTIRSEGAEKIANILLDEKDARPIWIQAWGGTNTISRALKIIEEEHPNRMIEVANKMRLFLIWEQDNTYQDYIRKVWEPLNVLTIISDQFDCMAYIWNKVLPNSIQSSFDSKWITKNILNNKGPLCAAYENKQGAFNAEGDTPSFLHAIPNGLNSVESPSYGGWGGRYKLVRNNVWMDPLPSNESQYPEGSYNIDNSWSKKMEYTLDSTTINSRTKYFKPIWRWLSQVQNDFAARANWCVSSYEKANHHPVIVLDNKLIIVAKRGEKILLDASKSFDPDDQKLSFKWWHYNEADTYRGNTIQIKSKKKVKFQIPNDAKPGDRIHIICEVSDQHPISLTRYKRIMISIVS